MKKIFLISVLFLSAFFTSIAQDVKDILNKSYAKCQSVQNGYYEMTRSFKPMSDKDTSTSTFYCSFKKLKDDSLSSSCFHYYSLWHDSIRYDVMYTGEDFVTASSKDSMATIKSKSLWAEEVKASFDKNKFFTPFTDKKSSPIKHDSDFIGNRHTLKLIGEEKSGDALCYHIQLNTIPENDSTEIYRIIRQEYHYWIQKKDFTPIQYSLALDLAFSHDTMFQYEKKTLNKYEINNLTDENILTLNSIPAYYNTKDYVPYKRAEPLPKDSVAPDWQLLSVANEKISLTDLRGKLILIDFFYKSCYPCMKAIPVLQALYEKYKDKGLEIIGLDPFDTKENDIETFLTKRGVTYTVLLGAKEVAKEYRVSGYPTMYLIDKTGKIVFTQVGFSNETEKDLEEIILKNL